MDVSMSQSIMSGLGLGIKERLSALDSRAECQNEVNAEVSGKIDYMRENTMSSEERTRRAIIEIQEKYTALLSEMSKQNDHRFSLVESETKRGETQLTSLHTEQNELIWSVPGLVSRIESMEKEIGATPPTPAKTEIKISSMRVKTAK